MTIVRTGVRSRTFDAMAIPYLFPYNLPAKINQGKGNQEEGYEQIQKPNQSVPQSKFPQASGQKEWNIPEIGGSKENQDTY